MHREAPQREITMSEATLPFVSHCLEFVFFFLLEGSLKLVLAAGKSHSLRSGDCFVIPSGLRFALEDIAEGCEILEVTLPGGGPRLFWR